MKNKLVLGMIVAAVVAYVAVHRSGSHDDSGDGDTLAKNVVLDRIWIDHIPRNDRDTFQIFVAITEQPFGIFQATSQWKGQFEMFRYEAHGSELRVVYGQTGEREKITAKATRCNERGMDYCLALAGASRGVKNYYSMEDWVIDGRDNLDHLRERVATLIHE